MKKVVLSLLLAGAALIPISCKEENPDNPSERAAPHTTATPAEIALATEPATTSSTPTYLYVTARSGLSLRAFENLQSERLARMPYGTKVEVLQAEERPTMKIGGIRGGMDKVAFNQKTGYAFNGYLSRYFPPDPDVTVEAYARELQQHFPKVTYSRETGDSLSEPETTEMITLPNAHWHEAFFVAQELFDFPREFEFPNPEGAANEVLPDRHPKKDAWISQLEVSRGVNGLEKISYRYKNAAYEKLVSISQTDGFMELSQTEVVRE